MPLTILTADEAVPIERHQVGVCVPLYGAHDVFVECLRSLLAHTPRDVPLLISDDASPDERSRRHVEELAEAGVLEHRVYYVRHKRNSGFVRNVNDAFRRLAPADVVVVNSDCVVTEGWLDAFVRARQHDTLVATVSVLTNHGTILSLPHRNVPVSGVPQTTTGDLAAQEIAASSLRLHPRLPTLVGHCFLVTRAALDLVGDFDLSFSPGYGEEVDFAQRCVLNGLVHVLADDAFVVHQGSGSFSVNRRRAELQARNDEVIGTRYPYYYDWVGEVERDRLGPFSRSLRTAQRAFRKLSVSLDGRCLGPYVTGTQVATLELAVALKRVDSIDLRVVVPHDLGTYARATLAEHKIDLITVDDVAAGVEPSDIAHRAYQVTAIEDLALLSRMGDRVVVTHLDLIGWNNPGYFKGYEDWAAYRRLTRHALAFADSVLFISRTARAEALAEDLVPPERAHAVHLGTDHVLDEIPYEEREPRGVSAIDGRPFLLCLGTNFRHKNRLFALRLLRELRERHGWDGGLVLAGAHVASGSSATEEAAFLSRHPELADVVVDVAAVDEGEKRWLLDNATMMVYPSVHEGFGFVPFEAAEAGLACAFASQTSLAELLPRSLALIEPWDAAITAERVHPLLESPALRAELVAGVRACAARLTWRAAIQQIVGLYEGVVRHPSREARLLVETLAFERQRMEAEAERLRQRFNDLEQAFYRLDRSFDDLDRQLVGPRGTIPEELRRPLLAVMTRPSLRDPLLRAVRSGYRLGYRLRHGGRAPSA